MLNINFKWSGKPHDCIYCDNEIEKNKPMIVLYWKKNGLTKKRYYYHVHCFTEYGLGYLGDMPLPAPPGRPKKYRNEGAKKEARKKYNRKYYEKRKHANVSI